MSNWSIGVTIKIIDDVFNAQIKSARDRLNSMVISTNGIHKSSRGLFSTWQKGTIVLNQSAELLKKMALYAQQLAAPLKEAGQFEQYQTTLKNLIGSTEEAKKRFQDLIQFAAVTPFTVPGIMEAGNRLEALGRYSLDTIRSLGDLAAASGKDVMQAVEAYSNLVTGRTGMAIKQFRALLISNSDWTNQLGKAVLKNTGDVTASVEEMVNALPRIIAKKNFAGLMEQQSATLLGKLSNLEDIWQQAMASIGEQFLDTAKDAIDILIDGINFLKIQAPKIVEVFKELLQVLKEIAIFYAALKIGALVSATLKAFSLAREAFKIGLLGKALGGLAKGTAYASFATKGLTRSIGLLFNMVRAHPIGLAITAITGLIYAYSKLNNVVDENIGVTINQNKEDIKNLSLQKEKAETNLARAKEIKKLIEEYRDLAKIEKRSKDEEERFLEVSIQLKNMLPHLARKIDNGVYNSNKFTAAFKKASEGLEDFQNEINNVDTKLLETKLKNITDIARKAAEEIAEAFAKDYGNAWEDIFGLGIVFGKGKDYYKKEFDEITKIITSDGIKTIKQLNNVINVLVKTHLAGYTEEQRKIIEEQVIAPAKNAAIEKILLAQTGGLIWADIFKKDFDEFKNNSDLNTKQKIKLLEESLDAINKSFEFTLRGKKYDLKPNIDKDLSPEKFDEITKENQRYVTKIITDSLNILKEEDKVAEEKGKEYIENLKKEFVNKYKELMSSLKAKHDVDSSGILDEKEIKGYEKDGKKIEGYEDSLISLRLQMLKEFSEKFPEYRGNIAESFRSLMNFYTSLNKEISEQDDEVAKIYVKRLKALQNSLETDKTPFDKWIKPLKELKKEFEGMLPADKMLWSEEQTNAINAFYDALVRTFDNLAKEQKFNFNIDFLLTGVDKIKDTALEEIKNMLPEAQIEAGNILESIFNSEELIKYKKILDETEPGLKRELELVKMRKKLALEQIDIYNKLLEIIKESVDTETDTEKKSALITFISNLEDKLKNLGIDVKNRDEDLKRTSLEIAEMYTNAFSDITSNLANAANTWFDLVSQSAKKQVAVWLESRNKMIDADEKKALFFARTTNQEARIKEEADLKRKKAEEEANAKYKEKMKGIFEFQKALNITNILMNTAAAIMGAWNTYAGNIPLAIAASIAIGVASAAQIAAVSAQEFPEPGFFGGGYTGDLPEDKVAGVVHGKEFVVRSGPAKKYASLLEAINSDKSMSKPLSNKSLIGSNFIDINRDFSQNNVIKMQNAELVKETKELKNLMKKYLENPVPVRAYLDNREATKITREGLRNYRRSTL